MLLTDPNEIQKVFKQEFSQMPDDVVTQYAKMFGVSVNSGKSGKDSLTDNKERPDKYGKDR